MTDEFMRLAVTGSTYEDWKRMRRGLVEAHGRGDRYLREAARALRDWPQEIPRDPPPSPRSCHTIWFL
jgi:hypothetical protein